MPADQQHAINPVLNAREHAQPSGLALNEQGAWVQFVSEQVGIVAMRIRHQHLVGTARESATHSRTGLGGHPAPRPFVFRLAELCLCRSPDPGHAFDIDRNQDLHASLHNCCQSGARSRSA